MQLSNIFGLCYNNSTPHSNQPCEVYIHIVKTIQYYKITLDELVKGSVNLIYKRIVFQYNENRGKYNYNRIFSNMLPSYIQSFNFKLRNNFLPVNILYREYLLDNDSCCYFCHVAPESIYHIFGTCEKIQVLWDVPSI